MPLKSPSRHWKRFRWSAGPASRQVRFYALAVIAGFFIFFIIPRKSLSQRADEVIRRWDEQRLELTGRSAQKNLVSLFLELEDAGDNRRMARMAPIFLQGPFPQKDIETVAQAAFKLFKYWNDAPPPWQWALYQKINAFHPSHQEGPYCRLHTERARVRFQFQSQEPYSRLYLAGNWTDSSGRLAQFAGYKPVEMKDAGGGRWSASRMMQRSPFTHAYHCVVRTAPWPAGRAVGWATFHLSGEGSYVVRVHSRKPDSASSRPRPSAPGVKSRLALVGVDGASWHILLPLIQRDALPHWSRLLQEGCAVRLTAAGGRYAYWSLPSIHTAMTGYLPARHQTKKGYFGFSIRPPIPRVWDHASQHGLRVGTIGMWGTFPVERINGDMVSEAFFFIRTIDNPILKDIIYSPWTVKFAESFGVTLADLTKLLSFAQWVKKYVETVFPAGLEIELRQLLPEPLLSASADIATLSAMAYDQPIYRASRYLLGRKGYDLFINYLIDVDARSHISWQGFEPLPSPQGTGHAKPVEDQALLRSYQQIDDYLGYLMNTFDRVVVFSDHGTGSNPENRYVPFYKPNAAKLLAAFDPENRLSSVLSVSLVPQVKGRYRMDLELKAPQAPEKAAKDVESWRAFLSRASLKSSGKPLFTLSEVRRSAGGFNFFIDVAEPFHDAEDRVQVDQRDYALSDFYDVHATGSYHMGNGILLMWGKGVSPNRRIEEAYEEDVAPTVMYLLDLPVSRRMDGRPLTAAIEENYLASHPVKWTDAEVRPPRSVISVLRSIRWRQLMHLPT